MENEQTLKIPEFHFCTKLSEYHTLKNTTSITYHFAMEVPPPGAKINYSYADCI